MSFQPVILIAAMAATALPVLAVFVRGGSRLIIKLVTPLAALALSFHLLMTLRLIALGPVGTPVAALYTLVASGVPVLLAGYAFSLCFGREQPEESFRHSRRNFLFLLIFGAAFLTQLRHPAFVTGYDWAVERGTIHLGWMGKAYVSYLLIGIVLIGHNFERTYRVAGTRDRYRSRLALLGVFATLGFFTFALATGLLYATIGLGKLVAAGLPIFLGSVFVAHGYLRRSIGDLNAPVSRNVVYSSFTALAAGLFVLSIGLAAQVASWTNWSPDEVLIVTFGFAIVLGTLLLLFSNRFQRSVRRFVDRNFYVNRYDYRTQWSKITRAVQSATDQEELLDQVVGFLADVFAADEITVALRSEASGRITPVRGKGNGVTGIELDPDTPLYAQLTVERKALLFDRKPHDFSYIPIYAENADWLDATASQLVAPLTDGGKLVGLIGMHRRDGNDPFTFEDVTLLESISGHVAGALHSLRLAQQLAETRESELMAQWSSMLLHDLKNYLAPLRMAAQNLLEAEGDADVTRACGEDVARVAERMEKLVQMLSELRQHSRLGVARLSPNALVTETVASLQLERRKDLRLELELQAESDVQGDGDLLRRVLENLVANALDAMPGGGKLRIETRDNRTNGSPEVEIRVTDSGAGIDEAFLREKLFRPFATTKPKGLGIGLYQSRAIIRAHGGELSAGNAAGGGATFRIALRPLLPEEASREAVPLKPLPDGVTAR